MRFASCFYCYCSFIGLDFTRTTSFSSAHNFAKAKRSLLKLQPAPASPPTSTEHEHGIEKSQQHSSDTSPPRTRDARWRRRRLQRFVLLIGLVCFDRLVVQALVVRVHSDPHLVANLIDKPLLVLLKVARSHSHVRNGNGRQHRGRLLSSTGSRRQQRQQHGSGRHLSLEIHGRRAHQSRRRQATPTRTTTAAAANQAAKCASIRARALGTRQLLGLDEGDSVRQASPPATAATKQRATNDRRRCTITKSINDKRKQTGLVRQAQAGHLQHHEPASHRAHHASAESQTVNGHAHVNKATAATAAEQCRANIRPHQPARPEHVRDAHRGPDATGASPHRLVQ